MKIKLGLAAVVSVFSLAASQTPDSTTCVTVGQNVPPFTITTLDGKRIRLPDPEHRVVLLNFFATWCTACNMEMPELENQIWRKYKKSRLLVLSLGREQSARELTAYVKENLLTFSVASDPERKIFGKFATQNIPRNVVIGKDGTIVYLSVGYDPDSFRGLVSAVENALMK
jgi:peroxiredoxin